MAAHQAYVHVVKKDDVTMHTSIPLFYERPSPEENCILVRSVLVSLTANNLSYAHMGTLRNWWDTYPVPSTLPQPYNDPIQYGIVPVWGYAEVLESKVAGLQTGNILFGFWPSHDLPTILQLKAAGDCPGHFIETSPGRERLMNLYNRCILQPNLNTADLEQEAPGADLLAWRPIFLDAGRYISCYVFGSPSIHPLGTLPWSEDDADLSKAVVISLSASGKTARRFQVALVGERDEGTGPLGWMGVTAASEGTSLIPETEKFATKVISYDEITSNDTKSWIQTLHPEKIVIIDFASSPSTLDTLLSSLPSPISTVIIGVGSESKPHTPAELASIQATRSKLPNRIQMNMSGIRDRAMEILGTERVFREDEEAWEGFVKRGGLEGMGLRWGRGVDGEGGVEGGWRRICEGSVGRGEGMVFSL